MRLRMITPILPLVIAGRETILAHSAACSVLFPEIPIICGAPSPGPCQDRAVVDVSIDRNGLRPFSEEQVIEMLDSLRITVDIQ